MLIEDLSFYLTGLEENSRTKVVRADWTFQIGALSSGTFVIEIPPGGSIHYREMFEYRREEVVGSKIELYWESNEDLLVYSGVVTGISLLKSVQSVQYSLKVAGGPIALFNTTISTRGWWPFGTFDNSGITQYFKEQIMQQGWTTPVEFLKRIVNIVSETTLYDPVQNSQAAKEQFTQVVTELIADLDNLVEAPILENFFGYVGDFDKYSVGIRERLGDMLSLEYSGATYWQFLLAVTGELGISVVPWISKTFVVPNMMFTDPPQLNVVFPSMINSLSVVSEPIEYPDQVVVYPYVGVSQDLALMIRDLEENSAIVHPTELRDTYSTYAGNRYLVVPPSEYRYLQYIYFAQLKATSDVQDSTLVDESKEDRNTDVSALKEGLNRDYQEYCRNFAEYYYRKVRSEKDFGTVNTVFQPLLMPGFGTYIIDGTSGMNYRGVITQVSHSISEDSASSNFSVSYLVGITEEISFENPLWKELVPSGSGTASILLNENSVARASKVSHVSYSSDILDPGATPANTDALAAAEYTGRVRSSS